jgi:hypothetical protein
MVTMKKSYFYVLPITDFYMKYTGKSKYYDKLLK